MTPPPLIPDHPIDDLGDRGAPPVCLPNTVAGALGGQALTHECVKALPDMVSAPVLLLGAEPTVIPLGGCELLRRLASVYPELELAPEFKQGANLVG